MTALNGLLTATGRSSPPVLIIGAGKVGQAAARALKRKGVAVHVIDRTPGVLEDMREYVEAIAEAKRPETRDRRIQGAITELARVRPPK